jgi:DNA repair protein RadC
LELLLTYATPRKDTRKLSEDFLEKFGRLKNILNQPPSSLMSVEGIGESVATLISLFTQLAARSESPEERSTSPAPMK